MRDESRVATDGPTAPSTLPALQTRSPMKPHSTKSRNQRKPARCRWCKAREMPWTPAKVLTCPDMPAAATANGEIPHLTGRNVCGCYWTIASPKQELDIWKP